MITNAILKINPNAQVSVSGSDIDTCEITWHDGTTPISKADIKAMIPTVEQELKDEETQKETDASNGKQKLKDLGLTDAEIKALIG
tara:strand:+ start:2011 stop:2268 length:258 start_codon:yes stop_codon:yes gene_type:complete